MAFQNLPREKNNEKIVKTQDNNESRATLDNIKYTGNDGVLFFMT